MQNSVNDHPETDFGMMILEWLSAACHGIRLMRFVTKAITGQNKTAPIANTHESAPTTAMPCMADIITTVAT
jgi:hypothetical protein